MVHRKIRIELDSFDSDWDGCFALFQTASAQELAKHYGDIGAIERKVTRSELERRQILGLNPTLADMDKAEAIEAQQEKWGLEIVMKGIKFWQSKFLSGLISDDGVKRPMTKEDVAAFDKEVMNFIAARISGRIEKN